MKTIFNIYIGTFFTIWEHRPCDHYMWNRSVLGFMIQINDNIFGQINMFV